MEHNSISVPFSAFESACTRLDRANRRLWIAVLVLLAVLIATNAGWIYYESQYQVIQTTETQSVSQDGERNSFIGGDNISYGSSNDYKNKDNKDTG